MATKATAVTVKLVFRDLSAKRDIEEARAYESDGDFLRWLADEYDSNPNTLFEECDIEEEEDFYSEDDPEE